MHFINYSHLQIFKIIAHMSGRCCLFSLYKQCTVSSTRDERSTHSTQPKWLGGLPRNLQEARSWVNWRKADHLSRSYHGANQWSRSRRMETASHCLTLLGVCLGKSRHHSKTGKAWMVPCTKEWRDILALHPWRAARALSSAFSPPGHQNSSFICFAQVVV